MKFPNVLKIVALCFIFYSILYAQKKEVKIDDNLIKLEFAFANEAYGTKGDFLLENPRYVTTTRNNDIVVLDRYYIKIYNSKGNEKKILGGKGQGPGEFENAPNMYSTSPSDYFCFLDMNYYTVYDNNFKFIDKKLRRGDKAIEKFLEMKNLMYGKNVYSGREMYFISEHEKLYMFMHSIIENDAKVFMCVLLYDNKKTGEIKPLLYVTDPSTKTVDAKEININNVIISPDWGNLSYVPLPNRLIAYSNTDEEVFKNGIGYYKIHIISIDDLSEKMVMTKDFIPMKYPDDFIESFRKQKTILSKETEEYIKKRVYKPYIIELKNDSLYIFTIKILDIDQKTNDIYCTYDVFDSRNGKYLSTFRMKRINYIRNGYAYVIGTHKNGYNEIRVYKLDPSIYGKK